MTIKDFLDSLKTWAEDVLSGETDVTFLGIQMGANVPQAATGKVNVLLSLDAGGFDINELGAKPSFRIYLALWILGQQTRVLELAEKFRSALQDIPTFSDTSGGFMLDYLRTQFEVNSVSGGVLWTFMLPFREI